MSKITGYDTHDDGPGFVGIRFCQECNNMLYPKEDKENKVLMYAVSILFLVTNFVRILLMEIVSPEKKNKSKKILHEKLVFYFSAEIAILNNWLTAIASM